MTQDEYEKFVNLRRHYGVKMVDKEEVARKQMSISAARNYVYKDGKTNDLVMSNFEKALQRKDLTAFPNVAYFLKIYQGKVEVLESKLVSYQSEDPKGERYLPERELRVIPDMIAKL
jgi:hypothetical protein